MRRFYSSRLYKGMPILLQNAFTTFRGFCYSWVRSGLTFPQLRKRVMALESFSEEQIRAFQLQKLRETLERAGRFVPYYREAFKSLGFVPADLKSIDDLSLLPVINKDIVRECPALFVATDLRKKPLFKGTTSGTTGKSLTLHMDGGLIRHEFSFADRQYRWAGGSARSRTALLRGDPIVPAGQKQPPFWRYDAWNSQLWLSTYHVSEETVAAYAQKLMEFQPEIIFAYPSSLFILCELARSRKIPLRLPGLAGIVTSSETLFGEQKRFIEETLSARVYDWYGQFERVVFIGTCEQGSHHVFPDYGITEFLPGGVDADGEQLYELAGTGFINRAMPLIRYRTGDLVKLERNKKCSCGRNFPVVKAILGRANDVIVTRSGRKIGLLEHIFHIDHIRCGQIVQESYDRLRVLIVPDDNFTANDKFHLLRLLRDRVDPDMAVDIEIVDAIPLSKNGKFRSMISLISRAKGGIEKGEGRREKGEGRREKRKSAWPIDH